MSLYKKTKKNNKELKTLIENLKKQLEVLNTLNNEEKLATKNN